MSSPKLSVILITCNEAHNLADCLTSLRGLADEIVIVDSGSRDATRDIAAQLGARVILTDDWPGFGPQKNRALDAATGEWVLSIDADERVTPELAEEIRLALSHNAPVAYQIPRLSWYCGRFIRHSGWRPDHVLRLFRRDQARFSDDLVHERVVVVQGVAVHTLRHDLLHYSYRDFSQVLQKTDAYSTAAAQQAHRAGRRASFASALLHGAWAFVRTYVLRAGFLDGAHGLALAISNAQASYYKYLKLWLLGQSQQAEPSDKARG